jgi:hypothetical protein
MMICLILLYQDPALRAWGHFTPHATSCCFAQLEACIYSPLYESRDLHPLHTLC